MKGNEVLNIFVRCLKRSKYLSGFLFLAACGVVIASLIPPQILKSIIDRNLVPARLSGLFHLAVLYLIIIFFIGFFDFLKEAILTVLGQKITTEIRYAMMVKLGRLNHGYFTDNSTGVTVSRFMNDVDAVNSMFTSGIVGMAIDCLKVIGIVISVWLFKAQLGIITILLTPLIAFVTRSFQKRMLKAQVENRIIVSKVNNHIGESIRNVLTIKVFSKEKYMENKYTDYLTQNYRTVEKVNFYDSIFPPIIQITRAFVIGLIVVLSAKQLNYLGISLGMVAASIELISNLFSPIETLGMEFQSIQQAISGIRRVDDFLKEAEDNQKDELFSTEKLNQGDAVLEFHDVSFQYEAGTDIINHIKLRIDPLQKVAFTGRTGAGKSTLFKLILGLLKPTSGRITIGGMDVYQIPNREKRRIFGYVDQSFPIIPATVAEQISLQDPGITKAQIESALEFVGLLEYVSALKDGLDTQVNEVTFSQGQKQLLSIARAIVTDPPILLLDEITANLDSITEDKIITVLQKAGRQRMILSISHRFSSIMDSDIIVSLKNGKVTTSGMRRP